MKCPYCGELESRVLDSRAAREGSAIRRRRECTRCNNRFTTMERVEEEPLVVIKRDGRRELFDGQKIMRGLLLAGQKRNVPLSTWEQLVESIEQELRSQPTREIPTDQIGAMVLDKLRHIDEVAYVRFASVFQQFPDIEAFKAALERLTAQKEKGPGGGQN
ncbi:MAG TPA: transcriptional regulator NrdR [Bacillota bacterium]|jgi:transcriptional repressor NrdR|nr:transcriptional repressor NrdR [Bacillota bacterium]HOB87556.1 transcriptional regulator NrdR [Bacillota bacterium]HOP69144.1 transcriptional regulator NrdR [Bacillota bacterium]HPT33800.1 transcriptional regulator NrdR [Bacillota bacterium]HPZ64341.1 transcriptional regulator NrdR [Bacillota bacterium]